MGEQNYNNKALRRIKLLLEFLLNRAEDRPEKEVFTFDSKELSDFHALLGDSYLLEIASKKILEHTETKLEIRRGVVPIKTATGEYYQNYENGMWVHVLDVRKLRDYYYEIVEALKKAEVIQNFVLTSDGLFYLEGAKKLNHGFDIKSNRFKLLEFLAKKKTYTSTNELARLFTKGDLVKVRKIVGEIRKIIEKKMKVPGDTLFESDGKSGYRVTNVAIEGE